MQWRRGLRMLLGRSDELAARRAIWEAWPVYWNAIIVCALASLAAALVFGLIGTAIGVYTLAGDVATGIPSFATLATAVVSAFFSFVIGGWVAGEIAGIRRSETAMLHGAIVFLAALPLLMLFI